MRACVHSRNFPHSASISSILPEFLSLLQGRDLSDPALPSRKLSAGSIGSTPSTCSQDRHRICNKRGYCGFSWCLLSFRLLLQETVELEPGTLISAFYPVSHPASKVSKGSNPLPTHMADQSDFLQGWPSLFRAAQPAWGRKLWISQSDMFQEISGDFRSSTCREVDDTVYNSVYICIYIIIYIGLI